MTKPKKHIVHLVYSLDIGGLERVLVNCINGLPDNYEHSIITLTKYSDEFSKLITKPVNIYQLNKPLGHNWAIYKQLFKLLNSLKCDVLHSYNIATLEYQFIGFLCGVKKRIHAEHGRDLFDPDGNNKKYQWLRRILSPFVHHFVAVSNDLYQWLINTVHISKHKCKLIYNGVDTLTYSPGEKTIIIPSQQNKFVFGCVGRLQGIKNHKGLINAFSLACQLSTEFADHCQLTLVGDGPLNADLNQLASNSHAPSAITLAGARHDMANVYKSFDVFVMSSLAEGIPMTMLEAMATGLPVLSTNVGGISEIVSDANAILVQSDNPQALAEQMLFMFNNQSELISMQNSAMEQIITHFSEQAMIQGYKQLYKKE